MTQRQAPMTMKDYDACVVAYGRNTALWPATEQDRAAVFMETQEGAQAVMVDAIFDNVMSLDASVNNDFIARLQAIPDQHAQPAPSVASLPTARPEFIKQIESLLDQWLDPSRILSPLGLVSQAAVFAVVLGLGVVVGTQQTMTDSFTDYDVSADLFEVDVQEDAIDG